MTDKPTEWNDNTNGDIKEKLKDYSFFVDDTPTDWSKQEHPIKCLENMRKVIFKQMNKKTELETCPVCDLPKILYNDLLFTVENKDGEKIEKARICISCLYKFNEQQENDKNKNYK